MRDVDRDKHSVCVEYGLELLALYNVAPPTPIAVNRVRTLGLWRTCRLRRICCHDTKGQRYRLVVFRGKRSGCSKRPQSCLRSVSNGAYVIVGSRSIRCNMRCEEITSLFLSHVHVDCHSAPREVIFGCLNIRSVTNKMDDLIDVRRD